MSRSHELIPQGPVDLAIPFAENLIFDRQFDEFRHSNKETQSMRELNELLDSCGMIGGYEVITRVAFIIPEDTTPDEQGKVTVQRMDLETDFVGDLVGGRTLKIGTLAGIGNQSIRAVCLTFEDVIIRSRKSVCSAVIPRFDKVEDEERVYVPVFAVNEITRLN